MRIVDVDAHLHEPLDWVERTDPGLAAELGPPARFLEIASSVFGFRDAAFEALPPDQRPTDRWDLVPPGFVRHLEMTDERQPDGHEPSGQDPLYGAAGRLRFCDERGIDVQFLNPTFLVGAFVQAGRARPPDPPPPVPQTWDRGAAAQRGPRGAGSPGPGGPRTRSKGTPTGSPPSPRSPWATSSGRSRR